jgi:LacI family transcriptional regulator
MKRLLFVGSVDRFCWREVLRGLADEPRLLQDWIVHPHPGPATLAGWRALLRDQQPDAVLSCQPPAKRILPELQKRGLPLVFIATQVAHPAPWLLLDNAAIGRMAAEHFLERHFQEFAYIGYADPALYPQRGAGFAERLQWAQCQPRQLQLEQERLLPNRAQCPQVVLDFLRALPRPCALFAADDDLAAVVLELCQQSGIAVPQHLAVLGTGDDSLVCHLAHPPLSSIRLPYRELGRRAAGLLLGWRPTLPQESYRLVLPPLGITLRQSTAVMRQSDPLVAKAVHYIEANLAQRITISTLRDHLGVTTPILLAHFREQLRTTPAAEMRRLRIERAKHLLVTTPAPMKTIAGRCGFSNIFHFMTTFKQLTGMSVCEYRRSAAEASP